MLANAKVNALLEVIALSIIAAMLTAMPAGIVSAAFPGNQETEASQIATALHAVVQAAKQYQAQTGKEASSIDQLVKADVLKNPAKNVEMYVNDTIWQTWGN